MSPILIVFTTIQYLVCLSLVKMQLVISIKEFVFVTIQCSPVVRSVCQWQNIYIFCFEVTSQCYIAYSCSPEQNSTLALVR